MSQKGSDYRSLQKTEGWERVAETGTEGRVLEAAVYNVCKGGFAP